jgi:hypothetical protein
MDFEWVDIGKVPDYWRAIQSVLLGEVKNVSIPGIEVNWPLKPAGSLQLTSLTN